MFFNETDALCSSMALVRWLTIQQDFQHWLSLWTPRTQEWWSTFSDYWQRSHLFHHMGERKRKFCRFTCLFLCFSVTIRRSRRWLSSVKRKDAEGLKSCFRHSESTTAHLCRYISFEWLAFNVRWAVCSVCQVACVQFANALVSQPDELDFRLHLRNEFLRSGLREQWTVRLRSGRDGCRIVLSVTGCLV